MINSLQHKVICDQEKSVVNALVTGGAQGIGLEVAEMFCLRGGKVFVFDCLSSEDERVLSLHKKGITYIHVDIASVESIAKGFETLFSILGEQSLDVLVNNAGITRDSLALRLKEKDWDDVLDINLKGAFFCAQYALRRMAKQEKSYIVNISSVVGLVGNPGQVNYAASKAGLVSITKTLAKEYASRNVLVNAIAPGFIMTKMTERLSDDVKEKAISLIPLKRFGTPSDVANLVSFITSGKADYITGQIVTLDGGMIL